jgi:hypothetical protein
VEAGATRPRGITLAWVTTLAVLPNGNIVLGNCHAGPGQPSVVEVEPRTKRVVWRFDGFEAFGNDVSNTCIWPEGAPLPPRATAIAHSFFVAGPDFTGILGEDGAVVWDAGRPGARDGWVLANGNVLVAWADRVVELTRAHEEVFVYTLSEGNRELGTVAAPRRREHAGHRARPAPAPARGRPARHRRRRRALVTRDQQRAHADAHGAQARERQLPRAALARVRGQGVHPARRGRAHAAHGPRGARRARRGDLAVYRHPPGGRLHPRRPDPRQPGRRARRRGSCRLAHLERRPARPPDRRRMRRADGWRTATR